MKERVKANITFISWMSLFYGNIHASEANDEMTKPNISSETWWCHHVSSHQRFPNSNSQFLREEKTYRYIAIPCRVRWERRLMQISIIIMFVAYILSSLIILTTANVRFSIRHFYTSLVIHANSVSMLNWNDSRIFRELMSKSVLDTSI